MNRSDTSGAGKVALASFAVIGLLMGCSSSKAAPKTNVLTNTVKPTSSVATVATTLAPALPPTAAPTTAPPPVAVPDGYRPETATGQLSQGDAGQRVLALQKRLIALGGDPGPADGAFGQSTDKAVRVFQKGSALKADGIVGPQTLAALDAACKGKC